MNILKKLLFIFLIIFLSYWAIKPLFITGFFPMHDDTQVARVFEMQKSLHDGMFPVRWVTDLGYHYGYPIFNFYAPFAYYVGGFLNLIGIDALNATKLMMGLGVVFSGVFMYLFAKEFWGKVGGLLSAVLYIYAPYHAIDIYIRGDVAEFWAYAFIPLAFLSVYKVYDYCNQSKSVSRKIWIWITIGAVGYTGIILSHNLTALMVTPFLFGFTILLYFFLLKNKKKLSHIFLCFVFGIILAAFYWLPVFTEMNYTNVLSQIGGGADYKDHFVCLNQLWDSPWGFGGSVLGCNDGLSFKIGKLHILFSLFSIGALIFFWKKQKEKFALLLFSIMSFFIVIYLTLANAKFVWDAIPQMAFFQYPWRFLVMISFFVSFLGGASIWVYENIQKLKPVPSFRLEFILCSILLITTIIYNSKLFIPQTILNKTATDYTNGANLIWTTSKISDEYLPKGFHKPKNFNEVPQEKFVANPKDFVINSLIEKSQETKVDLLIFYPTTIFVNQAYFPFWHIFVDNKEVTVISTNQGMVFTVPKGRHFVSIRFIQTPIQKLANALSLTGVFLLVIGIITKRKDEDYDEKNK